MPGHFLEGMEGRLVAGGGWVGGSSRAVDRKGRCWEGQKPAAGKGRGACGAGWRQSKVGVGQLAGG